MDTFDDQPFPLRDRFLHRGLPILVVLLIASVGLSMVSGRALVERIYLEMSDQRVRGIADLIIREAPEEWRRLTTLSPNQAIPPASNLPGIERALALVLADSRMAQLKIYDRSGRLIYTTDDTPLGEVERDSPMHDVLETGAPQILLQDSGALPLYEIYVLLRNALGTPHLVFEVYEPVDYLNGLMWSHLVKLAILPLILGPLLIVLLWRMVSRAQKDIDQRTQALTGVKNRLARLVSRTAVGAARQSLEAGEMASQVIDATLYYSDVRSFTGFVEDTPPEQVVAFLNHVMTVQIREVRRHGGDVDKMIGDALLAVFEGPDRAANATACAMAVQTALDEEPLLPRGIGIGLHDGFVISGVIGPEERQDFTVIGDAVNVAARLSNLAAGGEVVADTRTLARAGHPQGFASCEDIHVKGRSEPLRIRRWSAFAAAPDGQPSQPSSLSPSMSRME